MTAPDFKKQAEHLLAAHAVSGGDADALAALLEQGAVVQISVGDTVGGKNSSNDLCFLLEGKLRVERQGADHRVLGTVRAPSIQGQLALLGQDAPAAVGVAETEGLMVRIPADKAHAILAKADTQGSNLRWLLMASLCRQLGAVTDLLATLLWEQGKVVARDIDRIDGVLASCSYDDR